MSIPKASATLWIVFFRFVATLKPLYSNATDHTRATIDNAEAASSIIRSVVAIDERSGRQI